MLSCTPYQSALAQNVLTGVLKVRDFISAEVAHTDQPVPARVAVTIDVLIDLVLGSVIGQIITLHVDLTRTGESEKLRLVHVKVGCEHQRLRSGSAVPTQIDTIAL